jgi:hypothetical protein
MNKSDLIRKYISENPQAKDKRDIARNILKLYPDLFKDLESARSAVRTVTGSSGNKKREYFKSPDKLKFFYNGFEKWSKENLNTEPQPWHEPFQIPAFKQLTLIADLHSVYLNHKVMIKFLKTVKNKEALILNGDLLDSESLSRHLKGHNMIEYDRELELCHELLKGLKQEFNHVYFKEGNHDFWLERYLLTNAREIFRLRGVGLKELLKLGELGVHHIHNLKYWTYGDLDGIHGHEFPGFGFGKFPATGLVDKWQTFKKKVDVKVISSHCHRADAAMSKRSKDGKFGLAWTSPAFCLKGAQYNPYAGWDNGHTELSINSDGLTEVKNIVYEQL